jgi:peptide/nickel transport system substrate-binding protein
MERRGVIELAAFGAAVVLAMAACSNGGGSSPGPAGFNAAVTRIVNPSNHRGGTLTFGLSSTPDSTDPGNTYFTFMWNFSRLYAMPLMTYKSCPGACGLQVVRDLATGPGVVSDDGLTWIYHLQPNVRFEDGTAVTSADVKYAVERTFARGVLPLGPSYFPLLLAPQNPVDPGPYVDRPKNLMGLKAVQTPNPTTIVFHLAHPFADFNYVAAIPQTAPVPPGKDTGANYQLHPISTGPYKFAGYQPGKQLTLVPNPHWNPATDPNAKQLVSKITVNMNMNAPDVDNRLLAGELNVDLLGTGVSQAGITTTLHGYPPASYAADFAGVPNYVHQHDLGIAFDAWGADWPDGYGFFGNLTNGAAISPSGNSNIAELNDPVVNNDLAKMAATNNQAQRNAYTAQIDLQVMKDAAILPQVYSKVLLYRNPNLTNVYVQPYYGQYNYAVLGLK